MGQTPQRRAGIDTGLRRRAALARGHPREHAGIYLCGLLDVEEVADVREHLEPGARGEVFFGVADEARVDAAVVVAVQVERGLGRRAAQLGARVLGQVVGDCGSEVLRVA